MGFYTLKFIYDQLMTRCSVEHKDASCFNYSKEEVIEMVVDAIYDDENLLAWVKSPVKEDYVITAECEQCGRKYIRSGAHIWKEGALVCDRFRIILGKELDISGSPVRIFLKSAYPV